MKSLPYPPVKGKNYSLFGISGHTAGFYDQVNRLADECLVYEPDPHKLLDVIRKNGSRRRRLQKIAGRPEDDSLLSFIIHRAQKILFTYTTEVENHLKGISPWKQLWDKRLGTTLHQHHLYMLEFTLVNRINKKKFLACDRKIALLPYCLQDFSVSCQSASDGLDYRCKHCSRNCYQNQVTRILKKNGIDPFIWMEADFRDLYAKLHEDGKSLGILGIACIPELANGMHVCEKHHIPAVGIPLDANRCIRWWGEFYPNSVNLKELKALVNPGNE